MFCDSRFRSLSIKKKKIKLPEYLRNSFVNNTLLTGTYLY